MVKALFKQLMYVLVRVTPKMDYCYMKGLPSFDDSLVAIYNKLPVGHFAKVVWSTYGVNDKPPFEGRGKTIFVKKGSFLDFWYGVFSRTIFTTHGHFIPNIPPNQNCVNVWHGMPLKAIGLLDGRAGRRDSLVCSTSALYQDILSRAFGVPEERVVTTGIPRNDLLLADDAGEIWKKASVERPDFDKVFMWLPTYRKGVIGDKSVDGVECDNVFNMVDFPEVEFQEFLKEQNALCIIKPHPMAPRKDARSSENILMIDEEWLWSHKLTLYPLLGQMDFLISDISSVMIDYTLLNRPIVVCFEDSEEYKKSRNLIFDPIEDWLPGEIVRNYDDLLTSIKSCISGEDKERGKRDALKAKFHSHQDFGATERLLSHVFGDASE